MGFWVLGCAGFRALGFYGLGFAIRVLMGLGRVYRGLSLSPLETPAPPPPPGPFSLGGWLRGLTKLLHDICRD